MSAKTLTIEQVMTLLAATPPRLAELTADLEPARLQMAPAQGEWSANDVLAHLRSCADVWGKCIAAMLAEDAPTPRSVNPRTWIKQTNYPDQTVRPSLHAFATRRAELLAVLAPLPPDAWSRMATVTGAGKPLERSVFSYAWRLAVHEQPHVKQVERIVNTLREARRSLNSSTPSTPRSSLCGWSRPQPPEA